MSILSFSFSPSWTPRSLGVKFTQEVLSVDRVVDLWYSRNHLLQTFQLTVGTFVVSSSLSFGEDTGTEEEHSLEYAQLEINRDWNMHRITYSSTDKEKLEYVHHEINT